MNSVGLNLKYCDKFLSENDYLSAENKLYQANNMVINRSGKGSDFLGWVDLPEGISSGQIADINQVASVLKHNSTYVVVIGIGGSYLGSRAVIEALEKYHSKGDSKFPKIIYAGHNLSDEYHSQLLDFLTQVNYSVIVISKSGTTTEPAIAFRLIREHLINKYGEKNASERIITITDRSKGALKSLADRKGYQSFIIPDDVGGRYSVLTPVGLLPIAVAGYDIASLVKGAQEMRAYHFSNSSMDTNIILKYAATRQILLSKGFDIEILNHYEPRLSFLIEWWKQLFGESEGKEGKGIFPAGAGFTTDLHSLGQYIQEGRRNLFSTVLHVEHLSGNAILKTEDDDPDGLNYLAGKNMNQVNSKAMEGTMLAHYDGGVPNILISIEKIDEFSLGSLIYFFEMACAVSGYMMDVNPFNQPGVEAYKKNMFRLLKKPGY